MGAIRVQEADREEAAMEASFMPVPPPVLDEEVGRRRRARI